MHIPRARFLRLLAAVVVILAVSPSSSMQVDATGNVLSKLDPLLQVPRSILGRSRVVLRVVNADAVAPVVSLVQLLGGRVIRRLPIIDAIAIDVPNLSLPVLAASPLVVRLSMDRLTAGAMERTGATVGATAVRQQLGYDGTGVGVAVIDSGVSPSHDDLMNLSSGAQRVDRFVDLVNGRETAYDDYGHGTHVAGIVAGNGFDSSGARSGIAPGARLIVLKVLDGAGQGHISDVIAAFDYVVSNKNALNIRIVNLSVATGVYESYNTDPLTLAAQRAVTAGIVVVAAAGNNGRSSTGTTQYAGVTAPGNAPWVLTVGGSSHMGTMNRADDTIAAFSSRGPGAIDYGAKPDIVAPGVGIESLSDPNSWMYGAKSRGLLNGTVPTSYLPYLSLSGTSMSAPVVTGTVALMLQANPSLTPNEVKAILQYTAEVYQGYDPLTQGAGFVNAKGAVDLAAFLAAPAGTPYPASAGWSRHIIWGNHVASGGELTAGANAWPLDVTWGASATPGGQRVAWGVKNGGPWQTSCLDAACGLIDGDPSLFPNVVWGGMCGGADCSTPWNAHTVFVTSTPEADTVVWGTSVAEMDTVVWGTSCTDPSCDTVVWTSR
jgi:serine protease AprX